MNFSSAQFPICYCELRNWKDRDKNGGGLIEFVRKGFITKRLKDCETKICQTFALSLEYPTKDGSALVCIGHPIIIILLFSLKN